MIVYVLLWENTESGDDFFSIYGIYSSKDKAKAIKKGLIPLVEKHLSSIEKKRINDYFYIQEWEVD